MRFLGHCNHEHFPYIKLMVKYKYKLNTTLALCVRNQC